MSRLLANRRYVLSLQWCSGFAFFKAPAFLTHHVFSVAGYDLSFRNGPRRGESILIQVRIVLGRSSQCDIALPTPEVSRKHCLIALTDHGVFVQDLASRVGTLVNGEKIPANQPVRLRHRDKVQVGKWKFRMRKRSDEVQAELGDGEPSQESMSAEVKPRSVQEELASELDAIAASLNISIDDTPQTKAEFEGVSDSGATSGETAESVSSSGGQPSETEAMKQAAGTGPGQTGNGLIADDSPNKPLAEAAAPEQKHAGDSAEKPVAESEDPEPSGPKRIPEHLRPRGPADSQGAADEALRRMFQR
ncbi:FHA domain-containing protein [Neorhodopirellula lusitana]|uniref:FHA domain-containing protein n=1 Tax=Neorhodopirellula lusitana TaxID=445327 RepID=A0ABY1PR88_9BACT|nr:FHA domain-containing protein [Neorhodopirellula lusitana]